MAANPQTALAEFKKDLFVSMKPRIMSSVPKSVDADMMMMSIYKAVETTPKLLEASRGALQSAIIDIARTGLYPNTPLGHASLIPYGDKVRLQIEYKGLMELARRSGEVLKFDCQSVHDGDEFDLIEGTEFSIRHKRKLTGIPGEFIGAYAVATLKNGEKVGKFMTKYEIDEIRKRSQGDKMAKKYNKESIWDTDYEAMAEKTVVKQLCKMLPQSLNLATGLQVDNKAEGMQEIIDVEPEVDTTGMGSSEAEFMKEMAKAKAKKEAKVIEAEVVEAEVVEPDPEIVEKANKEFEEKVTKAAKKGEPVALDELV